jgi:ABC-type glycerol-3-phosphate transport system substrate-binding protein
MDEMSARLYRRYAALALVTTVGLSLAACSSNKADSSANGKVTISVDCPPLKTDNNGKSLTAWNADVAAFEKANPNIAIDTVSVGAMCDNPPDFTARLQGGQEADVFYGYMTDLNQVLQSGQAADITSYINKDTVPAWDQITPNIKSPFVSGGKVYAVGYAGYTMGLVYNTNLFKQAGLDPSKPPTTWADVATDAKKIAALGNGVVGYEDYSAGNVGGWHFTSELYAQGGADTSADGKTATVNTPEGIAVLQNLHAMAITDKSMGVKQLLTWPDLLTNAAAGKVGMYIGAPDTITAIHTQFKGSFADWAMGPMPGNGGPAKGTLGGGSGYFFNKHDTAAQINAGLKWISFEELTPGQGQFNFELQNQEQLTVGLPEPETFLAGSALQKQNDALKTKFATIPLAAFTNYTANPVPVVVEPVDAQAIYAVLDSAMSATLTQANADPKALLDAANKKIQGLLDAQS